jgi:hypothetical protein
VIIRGASIDGIDGIPIAYNVICMTYYRIAFFISLCGQGKTGCKLISLTLKEKRDSPGTGGGNRSWRRAAITGATAGGEGPAPARLA